MSNLVPRSDFSEFRFRIPSDWSLNSHHLGQIHVIGLDGTPWPCKIRVDRESPEAIRGPIIHIARNQRESGHIYFVFPHPQRGELLLCTGTLPIADAPYDMLKELARGTLNRVRNQLSIWEEGGLKIPEFIHERLRTAVCGLSQSIMSQEITERDKLAIQAIVHGIDLNFEISSHFGHQISRYRCAHPELPAFWSAATIPPDPAASELIDRDFDYYRVCDFESLGEKLKSLSKFDKPLIIGPWLDASQGGLPPSLASIGDQMDRRKELLRRLREGLEQLPENVGMLHLVSGINGIGHRHLGYPQQTQLTIDMMQMVDESLLEVPTMLSFDFPWAERLAGAVGGIHPLQIADSLLRHGVPISYFGLEINLDYWPGGSALRDPFQWIDLIDIWAQLEVPLVILLRAPFGGLPVPADQPVDRLVNQQRSNVTDNQRWDYLKVILQLLVAKPLVHGLIWSQWHDNSDTRFPNGGMMNSNGEKREVQNLFANLHQSLASQRARESQGT